MPHGSQSVRHWRFSSTGSSPTWPISPLRFGDASPTWVLGRRQGHSLLAVERHPDTVLESCLLGCHSPSPDFLSLFQGVTLVPIQCHRVLHRFHPSTIILIVLIHRLVISMTFVSFINSIFRPLSKALTWKARKRGGEGGKGRGREGG